MPAPGPPCIEGARGATSGVAGCPVIDGRRLQGCDEESGLASRDGKTIGGRAAAGLDAMHVLLDRYRAAIHRPRARRGSAGLVRASEGPDPDLHAAIPEW